jgi:excisionase family DNA binding protein
MKGHTASPSPARSSAGLDGFEPVLTSEQAAVFLQIHPKTLQRMARQGRIPGYRVGDLWRFRASELEAWLASTMISSDRHSCRE